MSTWNEAVEEKLTEEGFCDCCQQIVEAGDSLWIHDDDVKCSQCRQKEIDQEN